MVEGCVDDTIAVHGRPDFTLVVVWFVMGQSNIS